MMKWTKKTIGKYIERNRTFLQSFFQRNIGGAQVWTVKCPNKHRHLEHFFFFQFNPYFRFDCVLNYNELIQSGLKPMFWSFWQVAWVTVELAPSPVFFYQSIDLQLSLFLNRKGGKYIIRKYNCPHASCLRCNTCLFVAVNRCETRSVEIGNTFYDVFGKTRKNRCF